MMYIIFTEGLVHEFILVADIAKKRDYFALMLFHDNAQIIDGNKTLETPDRLIHYYDIQTIEQYQGLGYEEMAERIETIMRNPLLRMNADLIVDGTGIGEAAVELMRKRGLSPIPIIFSGGDAPKEHYYSFGEVFSTSPGKMAGAKILKEISVPKKDLVAAGSVIIQQGRVRAAPGRWNEDFKRQLAKFKGKVNENTGNRKYEAETEADHDDLVVCFLMGAWWILNRKERNANPERTATENTATGWEPDDYM
jgi:hypothetical protein